MLELFRKLISSGEMLAKAGVFTFFVVMPTVMVLSSGWEIPAVFGGIGVWLFAWGWAEDNKES